MSDTPRTDAACVVAAEPDGGGLKFSRSWVSVDIARQLERDLAHAQDEIAHLKISNGTLAREALSLERDLRQAIDLLESCRGCDLIYDAWMTYAEGSKVCGVEIGPMTSIADLVDAFLKQHR